MNPYYVMIWDVNRDSIEYYDIMPYLISEYKDEKKRKKPIFTNDINDIKQFILNVSRYRFWSRCEYEIIVTGWPVSKKSVKLDAYEQIKQNINVIVNTFKLNYGIN